MTKFAALFAVLASMLACMLFSGHAQAQRARVFVASYGSDSNTCTFGSPCKTFQHAVDVVAAGGEVTAIDSAGFGPVTISQSVTITSPNGVEAGIVAPGGGTAITINATSAATITLRGLTLEGSGVDGSGVVLTSTGGGTLNIINTVVKDFTADGISVQPSSGTLTLLLTDVVVSDNGRFGIVIGPSGSASVAGLIKRATLSNDLFGAVDVDGSDTTGNLDVTVVDSAAVGGPDGYGFIATSAISAANTSIYLDNVTVNNFSNGYGVATASEAVVWITRSAITKNGYGVYDIAGTVYTFGDNDIAGNTHDVTTTMTPVAPQ